jgi:predicted TIM-barrel fold metal-dependent hydrolase
MLLYVDVVLDTEVFEMVLNVDTGVDSGRYILISADGHCGADLLDYKPYLESRYHDEFDAWASEFNDAWSVVDATRSTNNRAGVASMGASLNWDSDARLVELDDQGIAAEVLFPNTAPPFYPTGCISAPGPVTLKEYEYRFAGIRAHNRWLADFCAEAPARRAGFAQVFLEDVDAAIAEVRWARKAGLMGVLLPGDHVLRMANLYYPAYDPLWAACEELDLPVHRHQIIPTEAWVDGGKASPLVGLFETPFYSLRGISHMILAGVFERFPRLKFVTTETNRSSQIPDYLSQLDQLMDHALQEGTLRCQVGTEVVKELRHAPSEYFASNCYVAGPIDLRAGYDGGVPNLLWGADLPHSEGTSPFTREVLRWTLAGLSEAEVRTLVTTTAAGLYGFDLEALRPIADRIGPTVAEIATPITAVEWPDYPGATMCPAWQPEFRPASLAGSQ